MAVEVSRQDVLSDKIVDIQAANKFLKVPAESYLEMLGVSPLPSQMAIINAINNLNIGLSVLPFLVGREKPILLI